MKKSAKQFSPIAIIGQSCVLPGALTPEDLWQLSLNKQDCLNSVVPADFDSIMAQNIQTPPKLPRDQWQLRGGYVTGFDKIFNSEGFALPAETLTGLDPVFQYSLHCGREALQSAGYDIATMKQSRAGAIFGNLSYPTALFTRYGELQTLIQQGPDYFSASSLQQLQQQLPDARNCYMSGLPAHVLKQALNLSGTAYSLDAACASALYAISQACDLLHDNKADMMLAGAVNAVDMHFLVAGFASLQALSATGQSRPFHRQANGLVPGNGAGFVVLKRLEDAQADNDNILAVIRSIGLSNDGNSGGLLIPANSGQISSMQQAYQNSELKPSDIDVIECHATGTVAGDKTELQSMQQIFPAEQELVIAGLKSNMGHLLAASGIAALIRVIGAMTAGQKPPTLHIEDSIESSFKLLEQAEPWEARNGMRRAAVNCFGFGGNNAHLLLEQTAASASYKFIPPTSKQKSAEDIAIIGMQVIAGSCSNTAEFAKTINAVLKNIISSPSMSFLRKRESSIDKAFLDPRFRKDDRKKLFFNKSINDKIHINKSIDNVELPTTIHFPPNDLREALGQQLLILRAAYDAIADAGPLPEETTSAFVGMQCDLNVSKHGLRWRLPELLNQLKTASEQDFPQDEAWITQARDAIINKLSAAATLGCMPNVVTNRLNIQFNLQGPSFSTSSEELSGIDALNIAVTQLRHHNIDAAIVGAVDLCSEPLRASAAKKLLPKQHHIPGDAAVVLVLKRLTTAQHDGNKIYAVIPATPSDKCEIKLGTAPDHLDLSTVFGHTHCASGLLHVAAAAVTAQKSKNCVQVGIVALGERSDYLTVLAQEQKNEA